VRIFVYLSEPARRTRLAFWNGLCAAWLPLTTNRICSRAGWRVVHASTVSFQVTMSLGLSWVNTLSRLESWCSECGESRGPGGNYCLGCSPTHTTMWGFLDLSFQIMEEPRHPPAVAHVLFIERQIGLPLAETHPSRTRVPLSGCVRTPLRCVLKLAHPSLPGFPLGMTNAASGIWRPALYSIVYRIFHLR
jgi:hypothetical protein